jgi:hypothetical protein
MIVEGIFAAFTTSANPPLSIIISFTIQKNKICCMENKDGAFLQ